MTTKSECRDALRPKLQTRCAATPTSPYKRVICCYLPEFEIIDAQIQMYPAERSSVDYESRPQIGPSQPLPRWGADGI